MLLTDRKLRFADVVYAVDATPKTIRNWLARGQVKLALGEHDRGWREFSTADVAVLAIVRKLVSFGLTVEEANNFSRAVLMVSADKILAAPGAEPFDLANNYAGQVLVVWRGFSEWFVRLDRVEETPSPPDDAYIVLHLEPLLRNAITRAFLAHSDRDRSADSPIEAAEHVEAAISKFAVAAESLSDAAEQIKRAATRKPREGKQSANTTAVSAATPKTEKI